MMRSAITLVAAMLFAVPAIAAEDAHAGHHPDQGEAAAAPAPDQRLQEMQARMQEIRDTADPEARMRLMDEQMAAMESMMEHMQGGMGPGMMQQGPDGGMGPGMMQHGPGGGMGPGMMHRGPGGGMGPGMMQHGPGGGMGPGMMHRGPGGGMGPGMMQQGPGGGMGPGMMHQGPGGGMDPAMMQQRREMMRRCMEMMQRDMGPPGAYRGYEGR
jgi:hypothetical protein